MTMNLHALSMIWANLHAKLSAEHDLDDDELFDTLDGELDLADRLRSLIRKRREMLANADALKTMIKEMTERKLRLEKTAESISNAVVHAMSEAGLRKLSAPDFTVSLGQGKPPLAGAEHLDPASLPDHFVRVERSVNRTALREALDAGEHIPGVYLGNPQPFLTFRKT
jgi:hypothetical protein